MVSINIAIDQLFSIRNRYGKEMAMGKLQLLQRINVKKIHSKKNAQTLYAALLFLQAYPDNKALYKQTEDLLMALQKHILEKESLQYNLYNSGITGTTICAAFSFEMVKWLRKTKPANIKLNSFEADDKQIQSILSVVIPKIESEIFQDGNAAWKSWLKQLKNPEEGLLDQLIAIFDSTDIRPEVKDELWNALGINVEISFTTHCCLPETFTKIFYHRSLLRKDFKTAPVQRPVLVKLNDAEAEQLIDCSRMILVRHLREIDPISFTAAKLISYYQLPRGLSIVLMGMQPERRHPVDSYMGYMVFKNGLPVAYAGSWIFFDSARIGLNVFPDYRGGETRYIFDQVLQLHARIYQVKRFTVDPYQIGKDNSDGIHSGAFWVYYHTGFRPMKKQQQELALVEALKIIAGNKYRTAAGTLKILAESRMELLLQKRSVHFDATDISRLYAAILSRKYQGNRTIAEMKSAKKLAVKLQIKNYQESNMSFILKNWALLLLQNEKEIQLNLRLKKLLKKLFNLKAAGSEVEYISLLQQAPELRNLIEDLCNVYEIA
jgi:hypothetical protein